MTVSFSQFRPSKGLGSWIDWCPGSLLALFALKQNGGLPRLVRDMAMGHNLWLYFGVDEHPFATYFDVHQGYRVLTHSHMSQNSFSVDMPCGRARLLGKRACACS